jgi:uncharacterized membrane protein YeaQ/YmgE (transglycosylase-associated protein family)
MNVVFIGSFCFGLVVGWVTYRTLRRREGSAVLSDIATVIGAVGGGAVTTLFNESQMFAWYAIGLAVGFFLYLIINLIIDKDNTLQWMSG